MNTCSKLHRSLILTFLQGTFGREPQAKPEDDRYLRAAIQEYDNIAKLGQIMREGPIKVRFLWDYWSGSLCWPQHNPETPKTQGWAVETSHLESGWYSVSEFDTNCRPIRVPCWRWSWTTTWGWKSSLQLEWSQFPPARKTVHQSQRWALSAPAAVLFLSHTPGTMSNIPVVYQSDVLSAALTRALSNLLPLARQRCVDCGFWNWNWRFRLSLDRSGLWFWIVLIWDFFYNQVMHVIM